jgi:hypothetical protein
LILGKTQESLFVFDKLQNFLKINPLVFLFRHHPQHNIKQMLHRH